MSDFQRHDTVPGFVRHVPGSETTADALKWSAPFDPPAVGTTIRLKINAIGLAKVTGYATLDGWLGVMAAPLAPPDWWVKQNGPASPVNDGLVFGAEIALDVEPR